MKYFLVVFVLFLSACSIKNYEHTSAKIVIIKSPKIKFSDIGYIRHTDDAIELELFFAGRVYKKIDINTLICVDNGCMTKSSFNEKYLSKYYPTSLLQNIILGKKIYDGVNSTKQNDGFIQQIKDLHVNIKYRVNAKEIYFKDVYNHILIKIKGVN